MKSKVYNYSENEFNNIIQSSNSFSDCCKKIGLSINGSNGRNQIKKRCEELNISYQHLYNKNNTVTPSNIKYSLDEILVENSTYTNRYRLKIRLIKENKMNYRCAICGNNGEWNGKPLSLQLDHINGVNNDNRIENLRFLCPNCHSQTETFSGKNKN